jgi:hypothetical protein
MVTARRGVMRQSTMSSTLAGRAIRSIMWTSGPEFVAHRSFEAVTSAY